MRLIAHRGFANDNPENTRLAVRQAAENADMIEIDVRRCGSGELVVIHDASVDRVTNASGLVAAYTLDELASLDVLASGEGVPSLAAVLESIPPDVGVNIELKEPGLASDVYAMIAAIENEVVISSFDPHTLRDFPTPDGVRRGYLTRWRRGLRVALDLECTCVHPRYTACTAAFVATAHDAGLTVNAWTIADRATANRLDDAGVDGVIADTADVLGDLLGV